MDKNFVIAIDGYSSCGKSTLAKALAKDLHFVYVDSGAMYRAVTLYLLRNKIDPSDNQKITEALQHIQLNFHSRDYQTHISLNGEEVSEEIRQMYISERVSDVSTNRAVRAAMVKQQQLMGKSKNIVMDGRDIGTAVFPDAQVKIFMTADPNVRAQRRYNELIAKKEDVSFEEIVDNLAHRDYQDTTRKESPLTRAEEAIILDNTELTEREQLKFILQLIKPLLK